MLKTNRPATRALVMITMPHFGEQQILEYASADDARDHFDPFALAHEISRDGRAYPSAFACDYRIAPSPGYAVSASHLMPPHVAGAMVATLREREIAEARLARATARLASVG